jgi:hypothetical protein
VVASAGDEFKVLARVPLEESPSRSSVVPLNGAILVRTANHLFRFDRK